MVGNGCSVEGSDSCNNGCTLYCGVNSSCKNECTGSCFYGGCGAGCEYSCTGHGCGGNCRSGCSGYFFLFSYSFDIIMTPAIVNLFSIIGS